MEKRITYKTDGWINNFVQNEFDAQNKSNVKVHIDRNKKLRLIGTYYGKELLFLKAIKIEILDELTHNYSNTCFALNHHIGLTETGIKECIEHIDEGENNLIQSIALNFDKEIKVILIGEIGKYEFFLNLSTKTNIVNSYFSINKSNENKQMIN